MKKVLFFALALLATTVAQAAPIVGVSQDGNPGDVDAQPILDTVITDLGGGLFGYSVFLDDLVPNNAGPYFLDNLTFTGAIVQDKAGAKNNFDVDDEDTALGFDGFNYDMLRDSYFYSPFTSNLVDPPGIVAGPNSYSITAGSGGGSSLQKAQVAYIVASGPIQVSGLVSRAIVGAAADNFLMSGVIAVPEPTTWAMLVMGAAALVPVIRRRRSR